MKSPTDLFKLQAECDFVNSMAEYQMTVFAAKRPSGELSTW